MRVGIGYDSHRLQAGRPFVLGGVVIPHPRGPAGHSDGDVACHALIDALLGAAAKGDIGERFPDRDPAYKEARSLTLLATVVAELKEEGLAPAQADLTVLAQAPRLAPYKEQIRGHLAKALGLPLALVSVKATTGEGIGFVGRAEGVAALAVAVVGPLGHGSV